MSRRDDMVFRPDLGRRRGATAQVRARTDRAAARLEGRRSPLRRVAASLAARRLVKRRARVRRLQAARAARSLGGGAGAARGARAAAASPIAILLTVGIAAAVVATRLVSGRSFENIGQQVNNILLGDLDDQARAKRTVRQRFQNDPNIARLVGQEGRVTNELASVADDLFRFELDREKGRSEFLSDSRFQANGALDMLILRVRDKIRESWNGGGVQDAVNKLERGYQNVAESAASR